MHTRINNLTDWYGRTGQFWEERGEGLSHLCTKNISTVAEKNHCASVPTGDGQTELAWMQCLIK